jgi:hypothetical protein
MGSWIVAGLIGGVIAWLADWLMWSKVFTKGMDQYFTPPPAGQQVQMTPMLVKSFTLALVYGVLFAALYARFKSGLWVDNPTGSRLRGALAGMEFGTVLWLPTILLANVGAGVWYDRVRTLFNATLWAWLVRVNAVGLVVGFLMK